MISCSRDIVTVAYQCATFKVMFPSGTAAGEYYDQLIVERHRP